MTPVCEHPADPTPFDPAWRTATAVALARAILIDAAFDRLPILADALQDAGCDDASVLDHCRQCDVHEPTCWVVLLVLGVPLPVRRFPMPLPAAPPVTRPRAEEAAAGRAANRWTALLTMGCIAVGFLGRMACPRAEPPPAPDPYAVTIPGASPETQARVAKYLRDVNRLRAIPDTDVPALGVVDFVGLSLAADLAAAEKDSSRVLDIADARSLVKMWDDIKMTKALARPGGLRLEDNSPTLKWLGRPSPTRR